MSEPESSVSSDAVATPGTARTSPIAVDVSAIREALAALGVPESLHVVKEVETEADLYATGKESPASDDDQFTGLIALLQRVVTTIRAGHAIDAQGDADESLERHVLAFDRAAASTADLHVLSAARISSIAELSSPAYARKQLASNLNRASEEARWLFDSLTGIVQYSRDKLTEASGEERGDDDIPAPLFAARAAAGTVYSLLMLAYLELARPDAITFDEARLLDEVLGDLRRTTGVLVRYGVHRGMLALGTDEQGRHIYTVVEDIVAAAAGEDAGS